MTTMPGASAATTAGPDRDAAAPHPYYADKVDSLKDIFGSDDVVLGADSLTVGERTYPIVDDVIVVLAPAHWPAALKQRLGQADGDSAEKIAEDIQFSFGNEWQRYNEIRPEYENVFHEYFDIADMDAIRGTRVCDLGCGTGRWSFFLNKRAQPRELVLVDFSEAIFVARKNLREVPNALFFMGDIERLPFRKDFADFLYSLGVLHHIETDCLDLVRGLKDYAPTLLIYLYYALDNRPFHFRVALALVTGVRLTVSRVRAHWFREAFTWVAAATIYAPLCYLGKALKPVGLDKYVPLAGEHHYMNFRWWRLLAYDRFFTRVEQRVSRKQIMQLKDTFSDVEISPNSGYWHFICRR